MSLFRITLLAAFTATLTTASPLLASRQSSSSSSSVVGYTLATSGSNTAVNASGGSFYTGKATNVYCPVPSCVGFPNTTTVAVFDNTGRASMAANVPGGQDIYVAPSGALSFTEAHEEGIFPNGSFTGGFCQEQSGGQLLFIFNGAPNQGWATCGGDGQVFALIQGNQCDDPKRVTIYSSPSTQLGAFQYD